MESNIWKYFINTAKDKGRNILNKFDPIYGIYNENRFIKCQCNNYNQFSSNTSKHIKQN